MTHPAPVSPVATNAGSVLAGGGGLDSRRVGGVAQECGSGRQHELTPEGPARLAFTNETRSRGSREPGTSRRRERGPRSAIDYRSPEDAGWVDPGRDRRNLFSRGAGPDRPPVVRDRPDVRGPHIPERPLRGGGTLHTSPEATTPPPHYQRQRATREGIPARPMNY